MRVSLGECLRRAKAVSRSTKKPATNKGGKISAKKVTAKPATRKARKKGK